MAVKVTVWNEFMHEKQDEDVIRVYPNGIHNAIADFLRTDSDIAVRTATLDMPEHGLSEEVLADTDVLIWWGHMGHQLVSDEVVARVKARVFEGMGIIILHSGHFSKIFKALMGTSCALRWREIGEKERIWVMNPNHPIAQGLDPYFELPHEEMYGEHFDIPTPDELVFLSWFSGGNVFRSGCCYNRGYGKVFYFQPGHETYGIYYDENIQKVIKNAVHWAKSTYDGLKILGGQHDSEPLEDITPFKP